jgi:uncharacterized membrane protein YcjF (UPF0283 family)
LHAAQLMNQKWCAAARTDSSAATWVNSIFIATAIHLTVLTAMSTVVQLMQMQKWRDEALDALLASQSRTSQIQTNFQKCMQSQERLESSLESWVEELTDKLHSVRRDLTNSANTSVNDRHSRKQPVIKSEKTKRSPIRSSTYRRWKRAAAFEGVDM